MAEAGFIELIEKVEQSNTHLHKVEEHTRNSRRHLLEMKKTMFDMAQATEILATPNEEERREDVARQERLIDAVQGIGSGGPGASQADKKGGGGGMLGGLLGGGAGGALGGFLGAAGIGVGAATAGLGVLMAGGGFLLEKLAEFDGEAVKKNILALTDIGDELVAKSGSMTQAFKDGGLLVTMLTGLGVGLAAFGVGAGINAAVEKFAGDTKWAEATKKNVETLLGIADLDYTASDIAGVSGALGALGVALVLFGAGKTVATAADGINSTVDKFMGTGDFAQNTVDNVKKLLELSSIQIGDVGKVSLALGTLGAGLVLFGAGKAVAGVGDLATAGATAAGTAAGVETFMNGDGFGKRIHDEVKDLLAINSLIPSDSGAFAEGGKFIVIMGGLAAGLVAFSIGKAASAAADGLQAGISQFSDAGNAGFAQRIKNEVDVLLSIASTPMVEPVKFVSTMTMIGSGLAVFAVGEAATAVSGFMSTFAGEGDQSTAKRIKGEVDLLLSIGQDGDLDKSAKAAEAMGKVGSALTVFAAKEFVGSLANAGSAIVNFFSGGEGPFEKIKSLADDADDLEKAAGAIGSVAENMNKIANIKISRNTVNFKKFGEDLKAGVPAIEAAVLGDPGGLFFGDKIEGLSKNSQQFAVAAENIATLRTALGDSQPASITNNYYGGGPGQGEATAIPNTPPPSNNDGVLKSGSAHADASDSSAIIKSGAHPRAAAMQRLQGF